MNEKIVGWYHTGSTMRRSDDVITSAFKKYCSFPVIVRINLSPESNKMPLEGFVALPGNYADEKKTIHHFVGIPCRIFPEESETVGIEQLLRYVKDNSVSDLSSNVNHKIVGLQNFQKEIKRMSNYLKNVSENKLKPNNEIISRIQEIWYLIKNLDCSSYTKDSITTKINDHYLNMYISSMVRATIGINSLIDNKIFNKEQSLER